MCAFLWACVASLCFALLGLVKQAGELLASRIYGKAKEEMDYSLVATAVFTPVSLSAPLTCRINLKSLLVLALLCAVELLLSSTSFSCRFRTSIPLLLLFFSLSFSQLFWPFFVQFRRCVFLCRLACAVHEFILDFPFI